LNIVKADAHFADMLGWIGRCPEADQRVHLTHDAFSTVCPSDPHLAVSQSCLEVIDPGRGLQVYVNVDAAMAIIIGTDSILNAL
jgi:hypothetical protein